MSTDYSSIYSIKEFYQKVIPLYFDKEKLALSTVGDLGLFLDITGSTTEDMINVMGRYINEIMPGQAELPDFIYANAANYGVSNLLATPARMSMLLLIKEDDIIKYSTEVDNHKEFVLDSDMSILVDDLYFSIPYNIKIRSTLFEGEYNHMSFYDINYQNDVSMETVPFIKTMKTSINGDIWLVLRVNVYQYQKDISDNPITTNSKLNIPFIDKTFNNQLCNFEVFYTPAGSTKSIQLEKRADKMQPVTTPFVFYKLTGDNSIRFSFANDDRYFVPDYNSTISIHLYETSGELGNIPFNKNGIDVTISTDTSDESISYNRVIYPMGLSQGSSVGGKNQLTLDGVKLLTMEKQVTVNSYTTDNDLNVFFSNFASLYNHDGIFVKQRDDYAAREYGCFTKLGNDSDIYPTNTLNIRLNTDDSDIHHVALRQYIIKAGTVFRYENSYGSEDVVKKQDGEEDQDIEYILPPLMVIGTKPNKVSFYINTVDRDVSVDYTYFNLNSIFNFVVQKCNIMRNAIHGDDSYHITLTLARVDGVFNNIQSTDFVMQETNGELDIDKLEVLVIFNTSVGNYIRMKCESAEKVSNDYLYTFTADIGTTDMISDGRILLTDLQKREDDSSDERLVDMMSPDIKFAVFYDYDGVDESHDYNDISVVENHTLCNIYTPQQDEFYFAYPMNLIRSHVMFEDRPDTESGFGFYIKQVPLFGKDFLLNTDNLGGVLDTITSEHDFLESLVDSLHGLFSINMKFFNTYGRARSFYIGYGTDHEIINRVNCTFHIGIKFYDGIIQEDYLYQIKAFIKNFIEELNKLTTGSNQAYISVLNQKLHNTFADQIKYAIFYSINDYDSKYQVIESNPDMSDNALVNYIPEYLTISTDNIHITSL